MKYITILCLLSVHLTFAQGYITVKNGAISSGSNYSNMDSYYAVQNGDVIVLNDETKGSPYLYPNFKNAVLIEDGKSKEQVRLNYNAYYDIFVVENKIPGEEPKEYVTKANAIQVKIGSDHFAALTDPENNNRLRYYQILMTGPKLHLYKKHDKTYRPKSMATSSMTRDIPAQFKDKSSLYFVDAAGNMKEVPNSQGKILKLFPSHQKEVKSCVKKNKLRVNKESDLMRLVRFYNSL